MVWFAILTISSKKYKVIVFLKDKLHIKGKLPKENLTIRQAELIKKDTKRTRVAYLLLRSLLGKSVVTQDRAFLAVPGCKVLWHCKFAVAS